MCPRGPKPSADKPGGTSGRGTKGPPPQPPFNSWADPGLSRGTGPRPPSWGSDSAKYTELNAEGREDWDPRGEARRPRGPSVTRRVWPPAERPGPGPQPPRSAAAGSAQQPQVGAGAELWAVSSAPLPVYPELVGAQRASGVPREPMWVRDGWPRVSLGTCPEPGRPGSPGLN